MPRVKTVGRAKWRSAQTEYLSKADDQSQIGYPPFALEEISQPLCLLMFSFVRRLPLPRGDEDPPQVGGQALDKARGRKPRNEARPFSRGAALWAFERRPIAQVRDEHGAAPGAACCVKPLRAFGGMGDVPAARLMTRMPVAGAGGLDQARPNGCWR